MMTSTLLRQRRGMTLIEMMFTVMITALVCGGIWSMSIFVERMRAQDEIKLDLADDAREAMEKILWGYKPANDPTAQREGVREAVSYSVLGGGTRLQFTSTTGVTREVRLNGTSIQYSEPGLNPLWATLYAPPASATALTTLKFKTSDTSADVVVIELVLGRRVQNRWLYASLQSKALVRN